MSDIDNDGESRDSDYFRSATRSPNVVREAGASLRASTRASLARKLRYNWREDPLSTLARFFSIYRPKSDKEDTHTTRLPNLARCLVLLRRYLTHFGMPKQGGIRDRDYVLRRLVQDLYEGGAPIWALEPVLNQAAEGLHGSTDVNWCVLPRKVGLTRSRRV
jgi:hypothetical protein